jgi:hypothetical protein
MSLQVNGILFGRCISCGAWVPDRTLIDNELCEGCAPTLRIRAKWRVRCGAVLRQAANYIDPPRVERPWGVDLNAQGKRPEA